MKRLLALMGLAVMIALPSWAADEAGLIKVAKGTVTIERSGQKMIVTAGMPVLAGDRVVTGEDGSVGITLKDNTLLSAGPKSLFVLNSFAFNEATHEGGLDASLKRGTLSVVSGKLAKNTPDSVKFRTPAAILGVRGTEFVIDAGSGTDD